MHTEAHMAAAAMEEVQTELAFCRTSSACSCQLCAYVDWAASFTAARCQELPACCRRPS